MNNNTTTIRIETQSYNARRYGKPWVTRVTFAADGKANFEWGAWVGRPGDAGALVIAAVEGGIIAGAQRGDRGSNTDATYYQVRDGQP